MRGLPFAPALALILFAAGCAGPVQETTYSGGLPAGTAVVTPAKHGGWQTQRGDAAIATPNGIEPESQMPYGGGASGIRAMEDEEF